MFAPLLVSDIDNFRDLIFVVQCVQAICMEKIRKIYNLLCSKPEWKHMLQRSNSRWDDNIKMDLKPTGVKRIQ
jgi:hypothetical protein